MIENHIRRFHCHCWRQPKGTWGQQRGYVEVGQEMDSTAQQEVAGVLSSERANDRDILPANGCLQATKSSSSSTAAALRPARCLARGKDGRRSGYKRQREREREAPSRAAANGEVGKGAGRHQQAIPRSASAFLQSLATATAPEHRQCTPAAETQRGWNVIILQWSCFVRPDLRDLVAEIDVVSQHDLGKPTDQAVAD